MTIPQNGRYVVRAELAAFALATKEALLNATSHQQQADFSMVLASRAEQQEQREQATTRQAGGAQSLALLGAAADLLQAGSGAANSGAALPSIAGNTDFSGDSVAVTGQAGTTNPFAGMGDLREGFENQQQLQALGQTPGQGGGGGGRFFGGPGGGGFGGPGGGGGGRGGRGGNFRNFKPSQPHGAIFWNGGPSTFNAQPFAVRGQTRAEPRLRHQPLRTDHRRRALYSQAHQAQQQGFCLPDPCRPALDFAASTNTAPSPPPSNARATSPISSAPTERSSRSTTLPPASRTPTTSSTPRSAPQALAVLELSIPRPTCPARRKTTACSPPQAPTPTMSASAGTTASAHRPETSPPSRASSSTPAPASTRASTSTSTTATRPATTSTSFTSSAASSRPTAIRWPAGYSIGKGKLTNNFTFTWNRNDSQLRNFFTNVEDVSTQVGILGPDDTPLNSDPLNYGLPNFVFNQFTGINQQQANYRLTQTFALSESSSWRHGKHNVRFGGDFHRVQLNLIGGTNSTGTFYFTGFATQEPGSGTGNQVATSGSSFADFLLGIPQETTIQSPQEKAYMRQNTWDLFAQDDWRALPNLTILAGLRYEYFSPYAETNDRLATLDYNSGFTDVAAVYPNQIGPVSGVKYPRTLIYPERNNFAPRLGIAWRPFKDTVVRAGYGINYTVGQYGNFIQNLAYQPPFANVQNNQAEYSSGVFTGLCGATGSLADCFSGVQLPSNYAVNPHYRLPYVQVWNLDIQRTLPLAIVLNVGYNGAKGTRLDVLSAPGIYNNVSATGVLFDFEDAVAFSNFNALVVRANKRLQNGIALQMTYTYSHSIDDASSVGAGSAVVAQNWQNILAEESNSSFDIRNQVKGTFLYELPFGPDKHYLSNGNWASHAFGDWSLSGSYTLADGTPLTPAISASVADVARGSAGSVRPDRVPGTSITAGGGHINNWFNTAAFSTSFAPGQYYGNASRYSIPGPGTTVVNMSLSKTFQFKDTKSFEVRMTADNAFNIVQYAGVNTQFDSTAVGQVTSARSMRTITFLARYRF